MIAGHSSWPLSHPTKFTTQQTVNSITHAIYTKVFSDYAFALTTILNKC